eukprot:scaffold290614_cov31-Tisochrysis_lutea.AAC.2
MSMIAEYGRVAWRTCIFGKQRREHVAIWIGSARCVELRGLPDGRGRHLGTERASRTCRYGRVQISKENRTG